MALLASIATFVAAAPAPLKPTVLQAVDDIAPTSNGYGQFTIYGDPVHLRYGQAAVRTTCEDPPGCYRKLPADVVDRYSNGTLKMAITRVTYDIVQRMMDGTEKSIPMWHVYNHHSAAVLTGYPAEAHATPLAIPLPFWTRETDANQGYGNWQGDFRQVVPFAPEMWYLQYHMIRTHPDGDDYDGTMSKLHQCPCSPQRVKDSETNTIDGIPFHPDVYCDNDMAFQSPTETTRSPAVPGPNTGCLVATFLGGESCCANNMLVVDTWELCGDNNCTAAPYETFYFKSTFTYEDATPDTLAAGQLNVNSDGRRIVIPDRPLYGTQPGIALYHAQFSSGGDYTVTACPEGTPFEFCANNLTWTEPVNFWTPASGTFMDGTITFETLNGTFKIVKAYPHAHTSIRSATLWNADTKEQLCDLSVANGGFIYGNSTDVANVGNENDYAVAQSCCEWSVDDAPIIEAGTPMTMSFVYNADKTNTGVMATWFFDVVPA